MAMRRLIGLAAPGIFALFGGRAWADNYALVSMARPGAEFVNMDTIKRLGADVRVWTVHIFGYDQAPALKGLSYALYHYHFDCDKETVQVMSFIAYDANGNIGAESTELADKPFDAIPGSVSQMTLRTICTDGTKPQLLQYPSPVDVYHAAEAYIRKTYGNSK